MSEAGLVVSGLSLGDRYRLSDHLEGDGRWSRWSAYDEVLDRPVTVLCFPEAGLSAAAIDAARRAGGVDEDRLTRVLDAGTSDGVGYIVEQPTDGTCTLAEVLQSRTVPAEEARRIVGEAAKALSVADARGLHHLALSPQNVALALDGGAVQVRGLGTEAALLGIDDTVATPAAVDARALVAVLYACLTGHWPLAHPSPESIGLVPAPWGNGQPGPPSGLISGLPAEFDDLVAEAWSGPDPTDGTGDLRTPADVAARLRPWSPITFLDYRGMFGLSPAPSGPTHTLTGSVPTEPASPEPNPAAAETVVIPQVDDATAQALPTRPPPAPSSPAGTGPSDVLIESTSPLEPTAPRTASPSTGPGRPNADLPLALVAVFVLILGIIGFAGLPRIDLPEIGDLTGSPEPPTAPSPTSAPAPSDMSSDLTSVAIVKGASFEPDKDGQVPSTVAAAAWDDDPDTAWESNYWYATADFGGLARTGYGLIADLGQQTPIRQVTVTLPAAQDLTVYVTNQATLDDATEIGQSTGESGQLTFEVPGDPVTGRLVIVLITSLAPDGEGHFRAFVSELEIYT